MKQFVIILFATILQQQYSFCQTTNVWYENRDGKVVVVMTEARGKEVALKLIDLKAISDSLVVLNRIKIIDDSISLNRLKTIHTLQSTNSKLVSVIELKDSQIAKHQQIEDILKKEIKVRKRRAWLFGLGGLATGVTLGSIIK